MVNPIKLSNQMDHPVAPQKKSKNADLYAVVVEIFGHELLHDLCGGGSQLGGLQDDAVACRDGAAYGVEQQVDRVVPRSDDQHNSVWIGLDLLEGMRTCT